MEYAQGINIMVALELFGIGALALVTLIEAWQADRARKRRGGGR